MNRYKSKPNKERTCWIKMTLAFGSVYENLLQNIVSIDPSTKTFVQAKSDDGAQSFSASGEHRSQRLFITVSNLL
ncbi:MAG: hypothetical protein AAF483_24315 [Planctomycetota bacterium]